MTRSSRASRCSYATSTSIDNRIFRPSSGDHQPEGRIQGHPDDPSSILDTSPLAPTARTRTLEHEVDSSESSTQALHSELNTHIAARSGGVSSDPSSLSTYYSKPQIPDIDFSGFSEFQKHRTKARQNARSGTRLVQTYDPLAILKTPPSAEDITLPMLLANQTHLGHHASLWHPGNSSYIFGVREGIHIISLDITYAYLKRAAKVVQEVARRGGLILFIGTRKGQADVVVRSAKRAGAYHIFDRWVPGTLTNGQQLLGGCAVKAVNMRDEELEEYSESLSRGLHTVVRPDLVISLNPLENEVCLHECGLYTIPTIGVIDTDANPSWVTYPIPANDDSQRSISLIAGVLSRAAEQGQKLRKEAALLGAPTYNTNVAKKYLKDVETIASMDVQDRDKGGDKDD